MVWLSSVPTDKNKERWGRDDADLQGDCGTSKGDDPNVAECTPKPNKRLLRSLKTSMDLSFDCIRTRTFSIWKKSGEGSQQISKCALCLPRISELSTHQVRMQAKRWKTGTYPIRIRHLIQIGVVSVWGRRQSDSWQPRQLTTCGSAREYNYRRLYRFKHMLYTTGCWPRISLRAKRKILCGRSFPNGLVEPDKAYPPCPNTATTLRSTPRGGWLRVYKRRLATSTRHYDRRNVLNMFIILRA